MSNIKFNKKKKKCKIPLNISSIYYNKYKLYLYSNRIDNVKYYNLLILNETFKF